MPPIQAMVRGALALSGVILASQNVHGLVVKPAVAGNDVGAVDVAGAVPGGHTAAGFLDDRFQRGDVPDVNAVFNHQLTRSLGNKNKAVEIAETALALRLAGKLQELFALACFA